ncbi:hypothetical protein [Pseudosulfitobacter sp. DSM 107133]|uniref:hypothetical protein n=1 Tax=Pseudosulfitobacter sp. DSM 107133 TaxID=2883100 RepID=UPI000DF3D30F|nr:hypothetical protein [Pseudosulfitobacter sp. DSM 107133]UOA27850.1 hypothetical protein DSM107133_02589 [Pseudosulfitobacter sp. DSM 107133]
MRDPVLDDPDLPLSMLFEHWPEAAPLFFEKHMLCPGCPVARFYTLGDACCRYGQDERIFREELKRRVDAAAGSGQ